MLYIVSIAHVIEYANFQLYMAYLVGVIWVFNVLHIKPCVPPKYRVKKKKILTVTFFYKSVAVHTSASAYKTAIISIVLKST